MTLRGRRVIGFAVVATTAGGLPVFLAGAMGPFLRPDLGIDTGRLGISVACCFAASSLLSISSGRLSERIGAFWALRLGMLLSAVLSLLLATVGGTSWWLFTLLLTGVGVAMSPIQPAANLAIAQHVAAGRQGVGFGIKQSAPRITTLLAGAAVPAIGLTVGWRWSFAVAAAIALAVAVAVPAGGWPAKPPATQARPARPTRREGALRPDMVLLAIACLCAGGAATSMGIFLVETAIARDMHPGLAGGLLAMGSVAGIAARLAAGWIVDRGLVAPFHLIIAMMVTGAGAYVLLGASQADWLLVVGTLGAFCGGWGWNGLIVYVVVRLNPERPGEATGVSQAGVSMGGVIGPAAFGILASSVSLASAWYATAVAVSIGAALTALVTIRTARTSDPVGLRRADRSAAPRRAAPRPIDPSTRSIS